MEIKLRCCSLVFQVKRLGDDKVAFYLTGDCHGTFKKIEFFVRRHKTTKEDILVILGDAGINYYLDKRDIKIKKELEKLPLTLLVIHGNHEARPQALDTYHEREWRGGIVYYEEDFPSLLFAKDGEIYDFDGESAIALGGAYSVDKWFRIRVGKPWFQDEQPSKESKQYAEKQLEERKWEVDYIFSHTCPEYMMPTDLFLRGLDQSTVDRTTEIWLEEIAKKTKFRKWYFGHFHANRKYTDYEMLYYEIKKVGEDNFTQKLGQPLFLEGDEVFFDTENDAMVGRIRKVNDYGTVTEPNEISYSVRGVDGIMYENILESNLQLTKDRW